MSTDLFEAIGFGDLIDDGFVMLQKKSNSTEFPARCPKAAALGTSGVGEGYRVIGS